VKPLLISLQVNLDEPSASDKLADRERLLENIEKTLNPGLPVSIGMRTLRKLPTFLRKNNFAATIIAAFSKERLHILDIKNDDRIYAVAVDIGTTNIVASLFDMQSYERICRAELENPQISSGLDVLTRVHFAMMGKADELHELLIKGINDLINMMCDLSGVGKSDIYAVAIAGNTIMSHFFMNLNVENIPIAPYMPACHNFDFIKASDVGLNINPESLIYIYPNAGSYVGGDIISGILSSGLYNEELPSLLIDVGTNAEIVLGCRDWILVGAGAAGPALEGGISEIGMRAIDGAIYSVEINNGCEVKVETINGKEPIGICGSGMIELISEMFKAGIIDNQGKFQDVCDGVIETGKKKGFIVHDSGGRMLIIKDNDIENFLRSKAAMFSSLYVITKSVGLMFSDINKVYISGAFGRGINAEKAKKIGMIPDIAKEKFIALGNSSLKGAEMLLMNWELLWDIEKICSLITYKEMNTESEFMKEFPAALFIPHTNPQILRA